MYTLDWRLHHPVLLSMTELPATEIKRLLNLVAQGSDKGVMELYRHYSVPVRDFIRSKVWDESAADEILNDTFLVMCRKPQSYNGTSRFSTWLCGIAKNKVMDWQRRQGHNAAATSEEEPDLSNLLALDWDVLAQLEDDERQRFLKECLQTLPPAQREALRQVFDHGLKLEEIAELQDVPLGTVKTRVMHARFKMTDCVRGKYQIRRHP